MDSYLRIKKEGLKITNKKDDIKKIAEQYKNENGNNRISNKDILFYLIKRIDDLEKKTDAANNEQDKKIQSNCTAIKILWILLPVGASIAFYVGSLL